MKIKKSKKLMVYTQQPVIPVYRLGEYFVHENITNQDEYSVSHVEGLKLADFDTLERAKQFCDNCHFEIGKIKTKVEITITPSDVKEKVSQILKRK